MLFLAIFLVLGLVYYSIRTYLENDAMIKARFLAKEYMEEKRISSKDEIESLVKKYDELNDIGIKFINFKFYIYDILNKVKRFYKLNLHLIYKIFLVYRRIVINFV